MSGETPRLFVAVCLPPSWQAALAVQQHDLRQRLGQQAAALRWVRPAGCHLTLVFLGETPAADLDRIGGAVCAVAVRARPFTLRLGKAGVFGGRRPRVLFIRVEGAVTALATLQGALSAALGDTERRPFAPHITLARVPRPDQVTGEAITGALAQLPPATADALLVDHIALMESDLRPGGAVYTERVAAAFGAART